MKKPNMVTRESLHPACLLILRSSISLTTRSKRVRRQTTKRQALRSLRRKWLNSKSKTTSIVLQRTKRSYLRSTGLNLTLKTKGPSTLLQSTSRRRWTTISLKLSIYGPSSIIGGKNKIWRRTNTTMHTSVKSQKWGINCTSKSKNTESCACSTKALRKCRLSI